MIRLYQFYDPKINNELSLLQVINKIKKQIPFIVNVKNYYYSNINANLYFNHTEQNWWVSCVKANSHDSWIEANKIFIPHIQRNTEIAYTIGAALYTMTWRQ